MNTLNSSPENVILLETELREAATWGFERSVCAMRSWYPALGENAITEDLIAATKPAPVTTGDAFHPRCERGEGSTVESSDRAAAASGCERLLEVDGLFERAGVEVTVQGCDSPDIGDLLEERRGDLGGNARTCQVRFA